MRQKEDGVRVLMVRGLNGSCVIVATNSAWVTTDIGAVTDEADDIGLDTPTHADEGIAFLWEGSVSLTAEFNGDGYDVPESTYSGSVRAVRDGQELAELLAMEPPDDPAAALTKGVMPGVVACSFKAGVKRPDVEELIECFAGVTIMAFYDEADGQPGWARFSVPGGQEREFIQYASDDVIVHKAWYPSADNETGAI